MDGKKFLVLDGALGTELVRTGFDIKDDPLWSARLLVNNRDAIKNVHKSFLLSGADVLITATYQASIEGLIQHCGLDKSKATAVIHDAVKIAHEACNEICSSRKHKRCFIAGSVGPYGACQHDMSEYTGKYVNKMSLKELMNWHRPRVEALLHAGVDILAFETIPALKEAEALVQLLKEFPTAKAWLTLSCQDGSHTCHGELFSDIVQTVNHSKQSLLQSIKGKITLPFVVYPNCGGEWKEGENEPDVHLCSYVKEWIQAGACWIGGCCGTQPGDVKKIRQIVDTQGK
ncbi:homocysteine S-methyltransferase YbgG-like isoform X2 [Montipora capricornis]|uniref:homocysteine S-methyltransferase YbgG-like isoform X2 n=1 Tax=Montipora capricornis TaxID=246305 RepID=UPI0035F16381